MSDNFDLKKFLKENKTIENSNKYLANAITEDDKKTKLRSKIREMVLTEMEEMGSPTSDSGGLKVKYTPSFFKNEENSRFYYTEKGLADGYVEYPIDGNVVKAKEIIGYFEGYEGEEDFEIIGHIYSPSQDIESYSIDQLDDAFYSNNPSLSKEGLYEADEEPIDNDESEEGEGEEEPEGETVDVVDDGDFEETEEVEGGGDESDIMAHLEAAMESARELGDEKLMDQLGNTITFYTRQHISK